MTFECDGPGKALTRPKNKAVLDIHPSVRKRGAFQPRYITYAEAVFATDLNAFLK